MQDAILLPGGPGVAGKPWSGRFADKTDRRVEAVHRIDLLRSSALQARYPGLDRACADARSGSDCSPPTNASKLSEACRKSRLRSRAGDFAFVLEREDIHMHIEAALIEKLGDVGRKLHTARSRNDQVATDVEALGPRGARPDRRAPGRPCSGPWWLGRVRHRDGDPAGLHAHAAGPAGAGAALFPGLCREARARPLAAGRLPQAAERPAAGRRRPGRHQPADRPRFRGAGAGLRRRRGQQPGCLQRPRLRRSSRSSC